eukprot:CAMPEP_0194371058 /NCGR_PEP_ID=MMETSP0174-20130528/19414_1 /TAXON_ID=216777 /ORGANISM="Proboscia alata, Strain PI-D3" /LENGTH=142 /DNA_ID=CAMNT_0039148877 /DNA_START=1 /DNA_END=425 /DNA_ORIENTATION=+
MDVTPVPNVNVTSEPTENDEGISPALSIEIAMLIHWIEAPPLQTPIQRSPSKPTQTTTQIPPPQSLLEILLSPTHIHPELLKRLHFLPQFLASYRRFTPALVTILCRTSLGNDGDGENDTPCYASSSHESVRHGVHDLLQSV